MFQKLISEIPKDIKLVAVTKMRSETQILRLYDQGQRIFGENRVYELAEKYQILPKDIEWHMIGHLQRNKVKVIAPFVHMIHSVDSIRLAVEINKQARKNDRKIPILLQIKIGQEEAKAGFYFTALQSDLSEGKLQSLDQISIRGVMGMASFVSDEEQIKAEFSALHHYFKQLKNKFFKIRRHFQKYLWECQETTK